jgi:hypothetical protein
VMLVGPKSHSATADTTATAVSIGGSGRLNSEPGAI